PIPTSDKMAPRPARHPRSRRGSLVEQLPPECARRGASRFLGLFLLLRRRVRGGTPETRGHGHRKSRRSRRRLPRRSPSSRPSRCLCRGSRPTSDAAKIQPQPPLTGGWLEHLRVWLLESRLALLTVRPTSRSPDLHSSAFVPTGLKSPNTAC